MHALISRAAGLGLDLVRGRFPKTIRIETTNGCNARCVICPHAEMERRVATMADEMFHRIVRECADHDVDTLHLHNFGEPLLDKKLPDRVALCKTLGIRRVKIFSNGSLLNEERGRALIEAGLDEIKISFDGASRAEFESIRRPLNYDAVVANVTAFVRLRDSLGRGPRVHVTCSSTTDRDKTMAALAGVVDGFSFGRIHNWASWDGIAADGGAERRRHRKPCARVWQTFTVLADGRVALCCLDYDGKVILGDLTDETQTIAGIWRGPAYARIRRLHRRSGQDQVSICATCAKSYW